MFNHVAGLRPKRHFFDKSFPYKTSMKMGELVPFLAEEVVPGDKYKIGNNAVIRVSPMVAPILDNIYFRTEYFFVPDRILASDNDFEKFYTGGVDGDYTTYPFGKFIGVSGNPNIFDGSLSDYFGLPKNYKNMTDEDDAVDISDKFHRAYVKVWNEFYRDENLQGEVSIASIDYYMKPLHRNWRKDYFTSALLDTQRGTAPAVPIQGLVPVFGAPADVRFGSWNDTLGSVGNPGGVVQAFARKFSGSEGEGGYMTTSVNSHIVSSSATQSDWYSKQDEVTGEKVAYVDKDPNNSYNAKTRTLNVNPSDMNLYASLRLSDGIGFNATDIRRLMQVQKFLERNMRAGVRLNEFLLAHFGTSPRDEVLQRPRFLGSTKTPIIISEVLQTSESTNNSPQGRLSGKGLGLSAGMIGTHTFEEPGIILGLMSIVPDLSYQSQGINKKFTRFTRFDYYFAEFAHLSEQPIKKSEIMFDSNPTDDDTEYENKNNKTFGYQGIYDDMRHNRGMVTGQFRSDAQSSLDYWHLARYFENVPALDSSFITCVPSMRIFEVQDEDPFQVCLGNILKAIRPMCKIAEPGLTDHF